MDINTRLTELATIYNKAFRGPPPLREIPNLKDGAGVRAWRHHVAGTILSARQREPVNFRFQGAEETPLDDSVVSLQEANSLYNACRDVVRW